MEAFGRTGVISYEEDGHSIDIEWEISGGSNLDILLAPMDIRKWTSSGENISKEKQKEILYRLREWLPTQRIKSDIDLPAHLNISDHECLLFGCKQRAINDSAFCQEHYDDTFLRH